MEIIELTYLERLKLALIYSVSEQRKEYLKAKIRKLENQQLAHSISTNDQINWLSRL